MSFFWIGGPTGVIVPEKDLNFNPDEDGYFLPGVIHGSEDYIIQAYYWSNGEGPEHDRIGIKYLYAESILEWAKDAVDEYGNLNEDIFAEHIFDAEEFIVENDGTGDFLSLNEEWHKSLCLSFRDVVFWADTQVNKTQPFVSGISILESDCYEKVKHMIPHIDANWWIQPSGYNGGMAACVTPDEKVLLCGPIKQDVCVRPVTALPAADLNVGDKVNFF